MELVDRKQDGKKLIPTPIIPRTYTYIITIKTGHVAWHQMSHDFKAPAPISIMSKPANGALIITNNPAFHTGMLRVSVVA